MRLKNILGPFLFLRKPLIYYSMQSSSPHLSINVKKSAYIQFFSGWYYCTWYVAIDKEYATSGRLVEMRGGIQQIFSHSQAPYSVILFTITANWGFSGSFNFTETFISTFRNSLLITLKRVFFFPLVLWCLFHIILIKLNSSWKIIIYLKQMKKKNGSTTLTCRIPFVDGGTRNIWRKYVHFGLQHINYDRLKASYMCVCRKWL